MIWLSVKSALRFMVNNIVVPHPKFDVPPSDPDPLFRFSTRTYGYPSQASSAFGASPFPTFPGLSSSSLGSVLRSTPGRRTSEKPLFRGVVYSPVSISPCPQRTRSDAFELNSGEPIRPLNLSSGNHSGRSPLRSLKRSKGHVNRISRTVGNAGAPIPSWGEPATMSLPSVKAFHSHSPARTTYSLQLSPIIEDSSPTCSRLSTPQNSDSDSVSEDETDWESSMDSNAFKTDMDTGPQVQVTESDMKKACRRISLDSQQSANPAAHATRHSTPEVPSLMLTLPTPVLPNLPLLTPLDSGPGSGLQDSYVEDYDDELDSGFHVLQASDRNVSPPIDIGSYCAVPSTPENPALLACRFWEINGEIKSRFLECGLWSSDSEASLFAPKDGVAEPDDPAANEDAVMLDPSSRFRGTGSNAGLAICSDAAMQGVMQGTCDAGFCKGASDMNSVENRQHASFGRKWGSLFRPKNLGANVMGAFRLAGRAHWT